MPSQRFNPLTPRAFLFGMLVALAAALLVIVAMALLGEYTKTRGRLLLTFLVLAPFCLSAIPPSALLRKERFQPVGWAGLVASGVGFILVATGIWATPNADGYWKIAAVVSILSGLTFQSSWLLLMTFARPFVPRLMWALIATTLLAAALSALGLIGEIKLAAYWWPVVLLLLASAVGISVSLTVDRRLHHRTDV